MPVYEYEVINDDGSPGDRFEIEQRMTDSSLEKHPWTGEPVRRIIHSPNLNTRYTPRATARKLDDRNVERAGFTKYVRDKSSGTYHKTAGRDQNAPDVLKPS